MVAVQMCASSFKLTYGLMVPSYSLTPNLKVECSVIIYKKKRKKGGKEKVL